MKYQQAFDGEWRYLLRGEKVACCDCGLIHTYRYRTRNGFLQRSATRDQRATYARRKRLGLSVRKTKGVRMIKKGTRYKAMRKQ